MLEHFAMDPTCLTNLVATDAGNTQTFNRVLNKRLINLVKVDDLSIGSCFLAEWHYYKTRYRVPLLTRHLRVPFDGWSGFRRRFMIGDFLAIGCLVSF